MNDIIYLVIFGGAFIVSAAAAGLFLALLVLHLIEWVTRNE